MLLWQLLWKSGCYFREVGEVWVKRRVAAAWPPSQRNSRTVCRLDLRSTMKRTHKQAFSCLPKANKEFFESIRNIDAAEDCGPTGSRETTFFFGKSFSISLSCQYMFNLEISLTWFETYPTCLPSVITPPPTSYIWRKIKYFCREQMSVYVCRQFCLPRITSLS